MILCNDILYILSYIEAVYFYKESLYSVETELIIQILYIYIYIFFFYFLIVGLPPICMLRSG